MIFSCKVAYQILHDVLMGVTNFVTVDWPVFLSVSYPRLTRPVALVKRCLTIRFDEHDTSFISTCNLAALLSAIYDKSTASTVCTVELWH